MRDVFASDIRIILFRAAASSLTGPWQRNGVSKWVRQVIFVASAAPHQDGELSRNTITNGVELCAY